MDPRVASLSVGGMRAGWVAFQAAGGQGAFDVFLASVGLAAMPARAAFVAVREYVNSLPTAHDYLATTVSRPLYQRLGNALGNFLELPNPQIGDGLQDYLDPEMVAYFKDDRNIPNDPADDFSIQDVNWELAFVENNFGGYITNPNGRALVPYEYGRALVPQYTVLVGEPRAGITAAQRWQTTREYRVAAAKLRLKNADRMQNLRPAQRDRLIRREIEKDERERKIKDPDPQPIPPGFDDKFPQPTPQPQGGTGTVYVQPEPRQVTSKTGGGGPPGPSSKTVTSDGCTPMAAAGVVAAAYFALLPLARAGILIGV